MKRRTGSFNGFLGIVAACLALAVPATSRGAFVLDDHFTGNSGGMPAGWSRLFGEGDVVEAGSTVTLGPDMVAIGSDTAFDPGPGAVMIVADIAGVAGQVATGLFVPPGGFPFVGIVCDLRVSDGRIEVGGIDSEGDEWYDAGHLQGYAGGPIQLTFVLGPTWFSVSTDSPPFSSGPIDYSAVFAHLTRGDLGNTTSTMLFDYSDPGASAIDRIQVVTEEPTPIESTTFGRLKARYRR